MKDCVFCRVLDGTEPGSFIYRDDHLAAFMTIQPVNPGHVLVVPVAHADNLEELGESGSAEVMALAHRIAGAIRIADLKCEGVNLWLSDGRAAGQAVPHFHLHIFPRYRGDGFGFQFGPDYTDLPPREELDRVAHLLAASFDG